MNIVVKAKWTAALRSGEYPQTKDFLQDEKGFCCLGVLCDLAVKDGVIDPPEIGADGVRLYTAYQSEDVDELYPYHEEAQLPWKVARWAGLDSRNPSVNWSDDPEHEEAWTPVSEPNDHGEDFNKIADMIDRDL